MDTPPTLNTIANIGKLDIISNNMVLTEEPNFPIMISNGFRLVVIRTSNVCLSFSPVIVPAVNAGTISSINTN